MSDIEVCSPSGVQFKRLRKQLEDRQRDLNDCISALVALSPYIKHTGNCAVEPPQCDCGLQLVLNTFRLSGVYPFKEQKRDVIELSPRHPKNCCCLWCKPSGVER